MYPEDVEKAADLVSLTPENLMFWIDLEQGCCCLDLGRGGFPAPTVNGRLETPLNPDGIPYPHLILNGSPIIRKPEAVDNIVPLSLDAVHHDFKHDLVLTIVEWQKVRCLKEKPLDVGAVDIFLLGRRRDGRSERDKRILKHRPLRVVILTEFLQAKEGHHLVETLLVARENTEDFH